MLAEYASIAKASSNWISPSFIGFPDAANSVPALGVATFIPFLNQNLANQSICSPKATFIEMETVHWLRTQIGYTPPTSYAGSNEVGGILTLGGCLSNMIGLMAAREYAFPGSGKHGPSKLPSRPCVLVPDVIEHYSIRSALAWLSLGEANVVRVPVDKSFRIDPTKLEDCILHLKAQGRSIMACVAYAGDSRSMAVDRFEVIAAILRRHDIWLHVDACHGFSLAFSNTHRHRLKGIELAHSVTIDPHKVLWIPNTCSYVLFRDPAHLRAISTNSDLILKTQWSLGQITPCIGSKAFDSLKLWSVIKYFGRSGIEQLIDGRIALAEQIGKMIEAHDDLLLVNQTDINSNVLTFIPKETQARARHGTFAVSAPDVEKLNEINAKIYESIRAGGQEYLHGFRLKQCLHPIIDGQELYVLRFMNGNPHTTAAHVASMLERIAKQGRELLEGGGYRLQVTPFESISALQKITQCLHTLLPSGSTYEALVYGSNAQGTNTIASDIDLMVFVDDEALPNANEVDAFVSDWRRIMREEQILVDSEVPFHRKLFLPMSFAWRSIEAVGSFDDVASLPPIQKSKEYLESDALLYRLVFNVLTTPTIHLSGQNEKTSRMRPDAEKALIDLLAAETMNDFIEQALEVDGRSGEKHMGYKRRPRVMEYLQNVWSRWQT